MDVLPYFWLNSFIFFNTYFNTKEQTGSPFLSGPWREKHRGELLLAGGMEEVLLPLCYIVSLFLGPLASLLSCSTLLMLAPEEKAKQGTSASSIFV